jgi:hypothetical protein
LNFCAALGTVSNAIMIAATINRMSLLPLLL